MTRAARPGGVLRRFRGVWWERAPLLFAGGVLGFLPAPLPDVGGVGRGCPSSFPFPYSPVGVRYSEPQQGFVCPSSPRGGRSARTHILFSEVVRQGYITPTFFLVSANADTKRREGEQKKECGFGGSGERTPEPWGKSVVFGLTC